MKQEADNAASRMQNESDRELAQSTDTVPGEFVTETFDYGGGRQVTVYVPPNMPEAIIFAGDGQRISKWGQSLERANIMSTMIVGVHGLTDEMPRIHRYSPGFEPKRFAAHEQFFVEDVRRWTKLRFGVERPQNVPRSLASRRAESWLSLLGFGIRRHTVRSSVLLLELATSHPP